MATSSSGHGGTGSTGRPLGQVLEDILQVNKSQSELLNRLLTVSRFGPTAGGTGSTAGIPTRGAAVADYTRQFEASQQQNYATATAFRQVGLGGVGGGISQGATFAQGMKGLGLPGAGMMSAAGPVAGAAVGAAKQMVESLSAYARIAQDPFTTDAQKQRALVNLLPEGQWIQRQVDSLTGRASGMEQAQFFGSIAGAGAQGRVEASGFMAGYRPQQAGLGAFAGAYASGSAVTAGVFDRGSLAGRTLYEDAQRALPYRREVAKTERDLAQATGERVGHEKELRRLQDEEHRLTRERATIQGQINLGGEGPSRERLLQSFENVNTELQGINQQVRGARQSVVGATQNETSAQGAFQTARNRADLLGRAENLEARAGRSEASAERLGGMGPYQRALGLQAIQMLESGTNPDYLPEAYKAAAQQFDPESYSNALKRYGVATPEFRARRGRRGFEGDYADIYRQADALRQQEGETTYGVESKTAAGIAKSGESLGAFIATEIQKFTMAVQKSLENQLRIRKNAS